MEEQPLSLSTLCSVRPREPQRSRDRGTATPHPQDPKVSETQTAPVEQGQTPLNY